MRARLLAPALMLLAAGCSTSMADMSCADVAKEAVAISGGELVKILQQQLVSQTDKEIVCKGMGVYARAEDTPTRFKAYIDTDGEAMVEYDTEEAQAAMIRQIDAEVAREQEKLERQMEGLGF